MLAVGAQLSGGPLHVGLSCKFEFKTHADHHLALPSAHPSRPLLLQTWMSPGVDSSQETCQDYMSAMPAPSPPVAGMALLSSAAFTSSAVCGQCITWEADDQAAAAQVAATGIQPVPYGMNVTALVIGVAGQQLDGSAIGPGDFLASSTASYALTAGWSFVTCPTQATGGESPEPSAPACCSAVHDKMALLALAWHMLRSSSSSAPCGAHCSNLQQLRGACLTATHDLRSGMLPALQMSLPPSPTPPALPTPMRLCSRAPPSQQPPPQWTCLRPLRLQPPL